jgi:hypothetical protein
VARRGSDCWRILGSRKRRHLPACLPSFFVLMTRTRMPYMIPVRLDHLRLPPFLALEPFCGAVQIPVFCSVSLLLCWSYLSFHHLLFHYVLRSANPRSFHLCTNIVLLFLFLFFSLSLGQSTLHTTSYWCMRISGGAIHRLPHSLTLALLAVHLHFHPFLNLISFLSACSGTVSIYMRICVGASCI